MCGICGFAGRGDADDLRRMSDRLTHRGPDAQGAWTDPGHGIYLGHRRLSIIDLAGGAQPMRTLDGALCVTFNGEIYNHESLRAELVSAGHRFVTSHADTEVLLHGYREWGETLPGRLNGMWAFALYDSEKRQLFLSRDRFGKKPLYFQHSGSDFAFASELPALLAHRNTKATVSRLALKKFFAYNFFPGSHSLYESIKKLPAGHHALYDCANGSLTVKKYWEFRIEPFDVIPADAETVWAEELRRLLQRAVERRLMADVPLGVFLSGGMDSSSVAYYAGVRNGYAAVKTFSIGFDEKSFDESAWSTAVAERLGTAHHLTTLSMASARDLLPEIAERLDEPLGDPSLLATYLLCKETRNEVTVALGGDGADELFAGYDPFRALRLAALYNRMVPRPLHRAISLAVAKLPVSHVNMSFDFKLKRTLAALSYPRPLWNPVWLGALTPKGIADLFNEPADLEEIYSEAIEAWDSCGEQDPVDRTLSFFTKLYLCDDILVKVDRASMLNSLEVRAPYLDIDLVDFVRKIPWRFKYRNSETKYLLKKALEPVLPRAIIYRPKKGFGVPFGRWFKEGSIALKESPSFATFFNDNAVRRLINEHTGGKADHRAALWNIFLLEWKLR
jgi:asparagine synthase (glutamine-hydrolysing)